MVELSLKGCVLSEKFHTGHKFYINALFTYTYMYNIFICSTEDVVLCDSQGVHAATRCFQVTHILKTFKIPDLEEKTYLNSISLGKIVKCLYYINMKLY